MGVFGDTLRQARAYKGVTIKEAEQATRINRHHLAALEDENFAALPPLIYQRGIVRNYATYLDLDAGKLLAMFEEAHGAEAGTEVVAAVKPLDMPTHWAPNFAIIAFMVVMSAIVFAWAYSAFTADGETPTAPPVIPTVTPVSNAADVTLPTQTPVPSPEAVPTTTAVPTVPLPTNTPAPSATAAPPSPTATTAPQTTAPQTAATVAEAPPVEEQAPPEPTPVPAGTLTLSIAASEWTGVYVSVTADGVVVFDQWLEPGQTTGMLYGLSFQIYTSAIEYTNITNHGTGQTFVMPGAGEGSFNLP